MLATMQEPIWDRKLGETFNERRQQRQEDICAIQSAAGGQVRGVDRIRPWDPYPEGGLSDRAPLPAFARRRGAREGYRGHIAGRGDSLRGCVPPGTGGEEKVPVIVAYSPYGKGQGTSPSVMGIFGLVGLDNS